MNDKELLLKTLGKMLNRCDIKSQELDQKYNSNKSGRFTFHAGWDDGYYKGKVSVLEEVIDLIKGR